MLLLRGNIHRVIKAGTYAVGMLALILACPAVNHRGLEVTFLDVGQGDGIFIRERGGITCLIDGGSSDVSKVGKYRIEPFLKARGVSEIDYAFITHGDSDHINGLEELLERQDIGVKISCVVFPEQTLWDEKLAELCTMAQKQGTRTVVMSPGKQVTGKNLIVSCLAPDGNKLEETLERLRDKEAAVLTTAESGAIILKADGKEVGDLKIIRYQSVFGVKKGGMHY